MPILDPEDEAFLAEQRNHRVQRVVALHPSAWEVAEQLASDDNPSAPDVDSVLEIAVMLMLMMNANEGVLVSLMKQLDALDPTGKYATEIAQVVNEHEAQSRKN